MFKFQGHKSQGKAKELNCSQRQELKRQDNSVYVLHQLCYRGECQNPGNTQWSLRLEGSNVSVLKS